MNDFKDRQETEEQRTFTIEKARAKREIDALRKLFIEYEESLGFDLGFQGFDEELDTLPGAYGEPGGCLMLARSGDEIVGCVALRPLSKKICEMKRMYIRPPWRGRGLGRILAEAIMHEALLLGYRSMRLDTIASMHAARSLYASLGFCEIPPYRYNPVEGAVYMEKILSSTDDEGNQNDHTDTPIVR